VAAVATRAVSLRVLAAAAALAVSELLQVSQLRLEYRRL
jgi:hypothetical protein